MKKIAEFLKRILDFLTGNDKRVEKIFEDIKNQYGEVAIDVLEEAKDFINRKDVEGFIAWTKTQVDDKLYYAAKNALPDVLIKAATIRGVIDNADNYSLAILKAMDNIVSLTSAGKGSWWRELSGMTAQILRDGKIDEKDISTFIAGVWAIYNSIFGKK